MVDAWAEDTGYALVADMVPNEVEVDAAADGDVDPKQEDPGTLS